MASTYSTSLRLELMATGDQSGTWGTTTNTNLGTLLEQAITGYLSVAQGDVANLTLTTVNGGTDQARNAIVRISGALTATRNVVVQTPAKVYTIANDTTGGFSIVAKTTAGTGVSIPPGAMIDVYSDGTNVVAGQNYFSGQIGGAVWLDAGATVGPVYDLFRDSTSPAVSDILGSVVFNGRDSAANKQEYASIEATITSPTSTTEASTLDIYTQIAGTRTKVISTGGGTTTYLYADPGAAVGPVADLFRDSASPAASDVLGQVIFNGRDSAANKQEYGSIQAVIIDPVSTTEDSSMDHYAMVAGTRTRIMSVGPNLDLAAVGQIQFPATQNPSAGANVLDDYEEGNWTPSDSSGAGLTFTAAAGRYTKIGRQVIFTGTVNYPANGSGASNLVGGLPFTVENSNGARGGNISFQNGAGGATFMAVGGNSTTLAFYSSAGTQLTNINLTSTIIIFSGTYNV